MCCNALRLTAGLSNWIKSYKGHQQIKGRLMHGFVGQSLLAFSVKMVKTNEIDT